MCIRDSIHVGAENVHFEKSGAYTGEISADMLTDLGVEYVVVGHSERRQYFAETDETVNKRAKAALAGGLKPIICVGESLAQREQGVTEELVRMQVKIALNLSLIHISPAPRNITLMLTFSHRMTRMIEVREP